MFRPIVSKLSIWSSDSLTFHQLIQRIEEGNLAPMVCQKCGFICQGEEYCIPTSVLGERLCPACGSNESVQATKETLNDAFDWHYPWCCCEHCGYSFLLDDDIATSIATENTEVEPGTKGCPNCRRLTA